jgi:two-component system sensor histidine kinase VicK
VITTDNDKFYRGAQFQSFFKNSSRSLVLKADAPHFTILAVSDLYLSLTHKQREQLLGRGLFKVFPGSAGDLSEQNSVHSSFMRAIANRDIDELPIFKYEIYVAETQSYVTEYWTNVNEPLLDDDGNVAYLINTTTNITRQLLTEQALSEAESRLKQLNQELIAANEELIAGNEELTATNVELALSEQRFRYLIQEAPVAIGILTGRSLTVTSANVKILEVWGKKESIIGLPLAKALPELEGQPFLPILDDVYTTGKPFNASEIRALLEHRGELKELYFNVVYQPIQVDSGSTTDILVVAINVTEQVNSRKAVERAEESLRLAIEAASSGTFSINTRTHEFFASPRLKELFGFKADEAVSVNECMTQIHDDYRPLVYQMVEAVVTKGERFELEYPVIGFHDGKQRWLRGIGTLQRDSNGVDSYFTGIINDITEQKEDEQRKNDFIGMVSHELKTPLTSLTAYLQMLQSKATKSADALTLNALNKSVIQVKKMATMINGFLNVSRLESGKIHIDKRSFDMAELVKEVEEESIATMTSHKVVFAPVVETYVVADRDKIGQVINNFISNAVKYSPLGTTIHIACVTVDNQAQVSVSDEGLGIKAEDQQKLFDRYYRVETNAAYISGFGIGLYLCAEIVQRHDGRIWVESEPGKGSTFYFSIPLEG